MTVQQLAHDLAARIPDMAKDSPINNADMIERMIGECVTDLVARYRVLGQRERLRVIAERAALLSLAAKNPQAGGEGADGKGWFPSLS